MRTLLVAACLAGGLLVGGCTASPATHVLGTTGAAALCGHVTGVTGLVVHRTTINKERFGFPATVRVTSAKAARAVARAACALPKPPKGTRFCPNAYGPTYHLSFLSHGRAVARLEAAPTGCPSVTIGAGTSSPAGRQATGRFWRVLGAALGIAHASDATFAGTLA